MKMKQHWLRKNTQKININVSREYAIETEGHRDFFEEEARNTREAHTTIIK